MTKMDLSTQRRPQLAISNADPMQTITCRTSCPGKVVVYPREKGKHKTSTALMLTTEMLAPYFDRPLPDVAKKLGVCCTTMKKVCRRLGIDRWPNTSRPRREQKRLKAGDSTPLNHPPESRSSSDSDVAEESGPNMACDNESYSVSTPQIQAGSAASISQHEASSMSSFWIRLSWDHQSGAGAVQHPPDCIGFSSRTPSTASSSSNEDDTLSRHFAEPPFCDELT
eukprot:CAMPEP_0181288650 /NCGR_PEP_ID=MMETSP1101-20121128/449_1 /TAXON_ID=46948 /ORGANISM="Rhodomonas abbreviata, Strain Caron Lab Isolate" /LENGTH=224 /DNA_ID=CAMNT_0023392793 /DNA_START=5 /DNA_END=675 /DNA_ORIENTATION=-